MPKKALGDSYLSTIGAKPKGKREAEATPKNKARTVHLPPDVDKRARLFCVEADTTFSALVAEALRAYLDVRK